LSAIGSERVDFQVQVLQVDCKKSYVQTVKRIYFIFLCGCSMRARGSAPLVTYFARVILTRIIYPDKNASTQKESTMSDLTICTAFCGARKLFAGPLGEVALHVKRALEGGAVDAIQVFDDSSGRIVDLDLRGSDEEIVERLSQPAPVYSGRYRAPTALSDALPAGKGRRGNRVDGAARGWAWWRAR
jgi:hypothetical protein